MMGRVASRCLLLAAVLAIVLPGSTAAAFEWLGQYGVGSATGAAGGVYPGGGIAIAPDGTVVVSDVYANRVAILAPDGRFQMAIGKDVATGGGTGAEICTNDCQYGETGSAAGELDSPWGLVAGPDEFYVAESNNGRVSVFSYDGQFRRAFGADVGGPGVNVCTTSCGPGSVGIEGGQMVGPAGLGIDSAGNLFISELGMNRVDVFDPQTGQFQRAFGKDVGGSGVNTCTTACGPGVVDMTPGSILTAFGLAVSADGEVFLGELVPARVSVFANDGQLLRTFGAPGNDAGQLAEPNGVAVSASGEVVVADSGNNRISVFAADGTFQRAYGLNVVPGGPNGPGICTTTCQGGSSGVGIGEFSSPRAVAFDAAGNLYTGTFARVDKWGERPVPVDPPDPPPVDPPPTPKEEPKADQPKGPPSNALRFGKRRLDRDKGTVRVEVIVAGPGRVVANAGPKAIARTQQPRRGGPAFVTIKARDKGLRVLSRSGRLWCALRVTFTPTGGTPYTRTKAVRVLKVREDGRPFGARGPVR